MSQSHIMNNVSIINLLVLVLSHGSHSGSVGA